MSVTLAEFLEARLAEDVEFATGEVDPARVLREVAAKRAILELANEASGLDADVDQEFRTTIRDTDADPYCGDRILRALAAVYSDHPDFDARWKP